MATVTHAGPRAGKGLASTSLPREGGWAALLVGLFVLYYVAPGVPLSLALLASCAVVCYLRLPLAVSLVPLAMPFYMLPKQLGHPSPEFSLGETAIALCAAVFALVQGRALLTSRGVRRRVLRRLTHPTGLDLAVGLFLVAATAATLATHGEALRRLALRQYRVAILEPVAYYVLAASTLRGARAGLRALWALAGAGLLVALLGLGQYVFRPGTLTGATWSGDTRHAERFVNAVYGSPDNLGLLLDRALPVAVALGLLGLATRGRAGAAPLALAYLPWLAVASMAAALLLSNSRGGIIVAVVAAVAAVLLWRAQSGDRSPGRAGRDRALVLAGLCGMTAVIGLVLWKVRHGYSNDERVLVWKSALAMIRDHPLLGVGPDNFLYYYFDPRTGIDRVHRLKSCVPDPLVDISALKHYMDPLAYREPCLSHPHNVVLDLWLSTGLLGLVALVAVLAIAGRHAWRAWRVLQARTRAATLTLAGTVPDVLASRAALVAGVVVVGATLAHGLVDNSLFLPDLAVDFWLAVALITNPRAV